MGAELPVVPVSTLAAMAQHHLEYHDSATIFTALDARMGEVYWGVYQKDAAGLARPAAEEAVLPAAEVVCLNDGGGNCAGVGSGWAAYRDVLSERPNGRVRLIDPECHPHSSAVAILGADGYRSRLAVAPEHALPVYLRNTVARKKGS
jgi:tRNA threonylcarbamoyladenosine biosynthesis protein TsaB